MRLNFSSLHLRINSGAWNVRVSCTGVLLDQSKTVATVRRDSDALSIVFGQTEIKIFGKLPTSQNGGEGSLIVQGAPIALFKCNSPSERWVFSDLNGNESTILKAPSLAEKVGKWPKIELRLIEKFKYLIQENVEITCGDIQFQSPKYVITDKPLLSVHEQKIFNESFSIENQLQVLTGILLIQTTFGTKFVN